MTDKLKKIAMQWVDISHSELKANYNNFKIVDLKDLEKLLKISYQKNEILIMATRKNKQPTVTLNDLMKELKEFKKEVRDALAKLSARIDNLVVKNHLIE